MSDVVFGAVVAVLVLLPVGVIALRLYRLRVAGVPIILRYLPAEPEHGWRHGTSGTTITSCGSTASPACGWAPAGRCRAARPRSWPASAAGHRARHIDADMMIVHAVTPGGDTELAFAREGLTAFQSWLESRPLARRQHL